MARANRHHIPGQVWHQPFFAKGKIATAGGCLASQYLASWVIARLEGIEAARGAMHQVAPVEEEDEYSERMPYNVMPYLTGDQDPVAAGHGNTFPGAFGD